MRTSADSIRTTNLVMHDDAFETEDRIVDMMAKEQYTGDKSPMTTMTGIRTQCTYYRTQIRSGVGQFGTIDKMDSDIDPTDIVVDKIENYIILKMTIESSYESQVDGQDPIFKQTGSGYLPVRTIEASVNDYFTAKVDDSFNLYRVTSVTYDSFEDDMYYMINFELIDKNLLETSEKFKLLANNISHTYTFVLRNLGTEYRSILLNTEYEVINDIRELYFTWEKAYTSLFYNMEYGSFFLKRDDYNYLIDELEDQIKTDIYDHSLVKFINANHIFSQHLGIQTATEYTTVSDRVYLQTLFHAIQDRSTELMNYPYYFKNYVSNPNFSKTLLGKHSLVPSPTLNIDCIDIIPWSLVTLIQAHVNQEPLILLETYPSTKDFLKDFIVEYVTNPGNSMKDWATKLISLPKYNYLENLTESFYILPIMGHILIEIQKAIMSNDHVGQEIDFK